MEKAVIKTMVQAEQRLARILGETRGKLNIELTAVQREVLQKAQAVLLELGTVPKRTIRAEVLAQKAQARNEREAAKNAAAEARRQEREAAKAAKEAAKAAEREAAMQAKLEADRIKAEALEAAKQAAIDAKRAAKEAAEKARREFLAKTLGAQPNTVNIDPATATQPIRRTKTGLQSQKAVRTEMV